LNFHQEENGSVFVMIEMVTYLTMG